ncbi:GMC family oxidoreductase N-terminal domain-containing protein [Hymenobacter humi]|uniref:GMC family oxidoreductase N-terminal domain-containing protein n=1 Tax=Hymenobacter humi TaxID=1411620 RepID=A0ABW2U434_9BACT
MDVTFIPLAVQHGADIRPNSFVTEIERDEQGRITGVVYSQNGEQHRQRCRHLFLCAGAVETPRLLLLNELALNSGQVGKNLMAHPGVQVFGTFEETVRPYKGIPGGLISQDTHRPKDADFVGGYLLQSIGIMPVTFAGQVARGRKYWGQQAARLHAQLQPRGRHQHPGRLPAARRQLSGAGRRERRPRPA